MGLSSMQAAEKVSPLTVLVRGAVERWLAPPILAQIASDCAISNYERKVTLQALTAIMLDAVLGMQPTVHAAAIARREEWSGSVQALYAKLGYNNLRGYLTDAGLLSRAPSVRIEPEGANGAH